MSQLTNLIADNEIIETLWYIFDIEKTNPYAFNKKDIRHYMFGVLFPMAIV